ncbi:MAG: hypothetical protein AAGA90_08515 [Actinomycetota bacterium]
MSLMPGMRVVGIFPRRFDADLAVARLESAGIEAVILSDTNPETGNLSLGARGYRIAVRDEIAEDASTVLLGEDPSATAEVDELDAIYHSRRFRDRPTWIRWGTIAVLAAMAGPVLLALLLQVEWLVDGVFP